MFRQSTNAWEFHWPREIGNQILRLNFPFLLKVLYSFWVYLNFMCWVISAHWSSLQLFHWGRGLRCFSLQTVFERRLVFFWSLTTHIYLMWRKYHFIPGAEINFTWEDLFFYNEKRELNINVSGIGKILIQTYNKVTALYPRAVFDGWKKYKENNSTLGRRRGKYEIGRTREEWDQRLEHSTGQAWWRFYT